MAKRRILPYEQGHFDGLCGVYAIINALFLVLHRWPMEKKSPRPMALTRQTAEKLYAFLIKELVSAPSLAIDSFIHGTSPRQLARLLKASSDWLIENHEVHLATRRPFSGANPPCKARLSGYLRYQSSKGNSVIIVGGQFPWCHWSVIEGLNERGILLFDSSGYRLINWKKYPKGRAPHFGLLDHRAIFEIDLFVRRPRAVDLS